MFINNILFKHHSKFCDVTSFLSEDIFQTNLNKVIFPLDNNVTDRFSKVRGWNWFITYEIDYIIAASTKQANILYLRPSRPPKIRVTILFPISITVSLSTSFLKHEMTSSWRHIYSTFTRFYTSGYRRADRRSSNQSDSGDNYTQYSDTGNELNLRHPEVNI